MNRIKLGETELSPFFPVPDHRGDISVAHERFAYEVDAMVDVVKWLAWEDLNSTRGWWIALRV
jgi:hypothetical protein